MADIELAPRDIAEAKVRLPWFVKVSPEFYDDACDTGYGWEGWAFNADDALVQALDECHLDNDREPEQHDEDVDPARAKVHVAEIDFRQFAGPLVHWARMMGGWEAPLWDAMEAAVAAADLPVVPYNTVEGR